MDKDQIDISYKSQSHKVQGMKTIRGREGLFGDLQAGHVPSSPACRGFQLGLEYSHP